MKFRLLKAEEIECRQAKNTGDACMLLLYKDARVDQNILDETVGEMNWQRHHSRDNANCIVSIWDDDKKMWIEKEDTGTESNTEAEKGLASDSFKRACFNWGIGRELYTAPTIWINGEIGKYAKFKVSNIGYDEFRNIIDLTIIDENGKTVWNMNKSGKNKSPVKSEAIQEIDVKDEFNKAINGMDNNKIAIICRHYKIKKINDMTVENCKDYLSKRAAEKEKNNE